MKVVWRTEAHTDAVDYAPLSQNDRRAVSSGYGR